MNVVELFCGSGNISRCFRENGHNVFSVDKRYRKNKCVPDLRIDIMKLHRSLIPFERVDVVWASPPCDVFSNASGNYYLTDYGRLGENAQHFVALLNKSLELISEMYPVLYFIENPSARMRYQKSMTDFISKHNGTIKKITLGSYGFATTKPTDIFTNAHSWKTKELLPFGRGAKCIQAFTNMTQHKRQETPQLLAEEIVKYCE